MIAPVYMTFVWKFEGKKKFKDGCTPQKIYYNFWKYISIIYETLVTWSKKLMYLNAFSYQTS